MAIIIKDFLTIGNNDWESRKRYKEYLFKQIIFKLDETSICLNNKYFYRLKITKTPSRINYYNFSFYNFKQTSRKWINDIWKNYKQTILEKKFIGGVKTISIKQDKIETYPTFNINYLLYSKYDNLDVLITAISTTRIKMIDPSLSISFEYLGNYKNIFVKETL